MTDTDWRVLVPVEILEGETVPDAVVELLTTCPVVVLGYHVLPEQTPPGQARIQFEDQAQRKLEELAVAFRERGSDADTRLVFTHDEEQTVDRIADETDCQALLLPNPAQQVERLLVPLSGAVNSDRVMSFVAELVSGRDISVTLLHVAEDDAGVEAGTAMVDGAAASLRDAGLPDGAVETTVTVSERPVQTIAMAAAEHDAVVMGESQPSIQSFLFGETSEQVAAKSLGPVVVVRRERPDEGDDQD